tara:strand:+ start:112 stop:213 length:102 start_codon:yes stop_codon:yes gene_type:complete
MYESMHLSEGVLTKSKSKPVEKEGLRDVTFEES